MRRLPGIAVDVAPPPPVEALPRMDVAVLVGFASTGPIDTPVAIESVGQFAAVFGADAPLAWDDTRGERLQAYLGPAVRAFFANGGRRCWVIRVARAAVANTFAIAGVLALESAGSALAPAIASARCEGSWSDPLRVATALEARSFALDGLQTLSSPASERFGFRTRYGLRAGDLIELAGDAHLATYASVEAVRVSVDAAGPYEVEATVRALFETIDALASPSSPSPSWSGEAQIAGFGPAVPATLFAPEAVGEAARIRVDAPVPASLERGHWARWSDGGAPVWLRIDEIERRPAFIGSPAAMDTGWIEATLSGPAWRELGSVLPPAIETIRRARCLKLEARVAAQDGASQSLSGIGLTPAHPSAWWNQSTDADFYRPRDDADALAPTPIVPAETARFALAPLGSSVSHAWIPLGVTAAFGAVLAPHPQTATALERDGLHEFDAGLFLDPELADASMHELAALADNIRCLRPQTRPLTGIHAAWSIGAGGIFNETTLIAVPDAVHLGWHPRGASDVADPQPPELPVPPHWHDHRGACAQPQAEPLADPDFGVFLDCATHELAVPVLGGPDAPVAPGAYRLTWTASDPGAEYVLLEATQADFSDRREIEAGSATEHIVLNTREGIYYYQVYARIGDERSSGSNAIAVLVRSSDWLQNRPGASDALLEPHWLSVHRALLRMAAANGELFAALAMPRHYRTQQALRYVQRLRTVREPPGAADIDALGFTEARALTYGAMYFPWFQSASLVVPPDGVALGVLAQRAATRGAWIAAANEPMKDVVALTPPIDAGDWQRLQDAQVNLVRADPRGFLTLSADTLANAAEVDLRPINVRRLLILLRRLALRRGGAYVFEPNGPTLRRSVQRGFEQVLTELFRRGAFAGATEEQSFRVVTDDTINTGRDADAGRFLVELRVAPSLPLRFVAVQLAQSGARLTVSEVL